jgi:hypothetical protein
MISSTNKNSNYQFDFEVDAGILLKEMIEKSFKLERFVFKDAIQNKDYSGSVRFILDADVIQIYAIGENETYFVKDFRLAEVNYSDYIENNGSEIHLKNQKSLESILLLSALNGNHQKELFENLKETCSSYYFFNRKELKVNNIKLSIESVESFVKNPVMVNYFLEAFEKALKTYSFNKNKNFTIKDLTSMFKLFYRLKSREEVDSIRFKFIERTLTKDYGFSLLFQIFEDLYLKLNSEVIKSFESQGLQVEAIKPDPEKIQKLFKEFRTLFEIKEVPVSFIWEKNLFVYLKDELLESLAKKDLVLKSSDFRCDLRVLSNELFETLIEALKLNNSKLELILTLGDELFINPIRSISENEFLDRLNKLKDLSETTPLTIKGLFELTELVQARVKVLKLIGK